MDAIATEVVALEQLQNPQSAYYAAAKTSATTGNIRLDAVRNAALAVGIRGGLKFRTAELVSALTKVTRQMDMVYNFTPYLIKGRVLPPVIVESRDIYTGSDMSIRMAGRSYKIESQARFVSRPPTWKDYLVVNYDVAMPSSALMPKDAIETVLWSKTVADGWQQGIEQANQAFEANFDRLDRDYIGVVRFHKLLKSNMISMPIIAKSETSISGDSSTMYVDEELLRITVLPSFNLKIFDWKMNPGKVEIESSLGKKSELKAESVEKSHIKNGVSQENKQL